MTHLYETLFPIDEQLTNDNDIKLEIINQMHGHTDFDNISPYYDLTSYNSLSTGHDKNINILHMNSRSLTKNFDKITAFLNSLTTPPRYNSHYRNVAYQLKQTPLSTTWLPFLTLN